MAIADGLHAAQRRVEERLEIVFLPLRSGGRDELIEIEIDEKIRRRSITGDVDSPRLLGQNARRAAAMETAPSIGRRR